MNDPEKISPSEYLASLPFDRFLELFHVSRRVVAGRSLIGEFMFEIGGCQGPARYQRARLGSHLAVAECVVAAPWYPTQGSPAALLRVDEVELSVDGGKDHRGGHSPALQVTGDGGDIEVYFGLEDSVQALQHRNR